MKQFTPDDHQDSEVLNIALTRLQEQLASQQDLCIGMNRSLSERSDTSRFVNYFLTLTLVVEEAFRLIH
jgi:hypothetical protein